MTTSTTRTLDADDALALHLLSEVVDPDDLVAAGHRLADVICKQAPRHSPYG